MRHPLIVFLIAVALSASVRADVLILTNKDRITGTVVREEAGQIVFKSDLLGEITVSSEVARVEVAKAPTPAQAKKPGADYKFKPLDLRTATVDPKKAAKAERIEWVRRVEFGLTSQSGRTEKSDLAFNFEAGRRGKHSEARFLARYLYGESEDERTSDLFESSLRFRRNLSGNTFAQSSTGISRDATKQIDLDGEQGFGLGRNFVNTESIIVAVGGGAAARYRDEAALPGEWDYLVDCFQDLRYEIHPRLDLVQDLSVVMAPANRDDYKVRLKTALTGRVTETIAMTMRYEYEYDRSRDLELRDSQRIVTSLVYVF